MRAGFLTALLFGGAVVSAMPAHAALVISDAASSNVTCVGGVCSATAADAVLNVKDLKNLLQKADLEVVSGSLAQDIEIDAAFKWTKPFRLTLDSWHSITFKMPVTVEGTGAVTLTTNDGGTGGGLTFSGKGKLTFWDTTSSLIINGSSFTLVGDIKSLATVVAVDPSGLYALARGYDASLDRIYKHAPVATDFSGTFEGLGHAIVNLSMQPGLDAGFFHSILQNGIVRDLAFDHVGLTANYAGVLAGGCDGTVARVSAMNVSVVSDKNHPIGGLVGLLRGTIRDSDVSGSVTSENSDAGGLAGVNFATILRSHANVSVSGVNAGGLAGSNSFGMIVESSASGNVSTVFGRHVVAGSAGGLVGWNRGRIDQSFATGAISCSLCEGPIANFAGDHHVHLGGLVGLIDIDVPLIVDSYASGAINAGYAVGGGLVGQSETEIDTSYAIGPVNGKASHRGGFSGKLIGSGMSNYWDIDTGGTPFSCGRKDCKNVTGLTDAQLKSGLPSGFDPAIWAQSPSINNGYPYLIANPPPQ